MSVYLMCIHQVKRKVMNQKTVCEKLKQLVDHFPTYHIKIILGDFNAKVGEEIIPNRQFGTTAYIRRVKLMLLE